MNAKKTVVASSVAIAIVMTALVAVGFSPVANSALAQVTNSSSTGTSSSTSTAVSSGANIQLSPTTGHAGTLITVTGSGFKGGSTVTLTFDSSPLTTNPTPVTVASGGTFSTSFIIPSNATSASSHEIAASDSTHSASAILSVTAASSSSNSTSTSTPASTSTSTSTSTASTSTAASATSASGSSVVQQGTVSSSNGNVTILAPRSDGAVFTGTISYVAGSPVQLYVLHAYGLASGQTVSGVSSAPRTITGPDGKLYAVTVITNAGSTTGESGSTVFSGNGLIISATGSSSFIAAYTLKASIDTPTTVNLLTATAAATTSSSSTSTSTSSVSTPTNSTTTNSTSSPASNTTAASNSTTATSSTASVSVSAGSSNDTISVTGHGFPPNSSVLTREGLNGATSGPSETAATDSSGSFQIQMPLMSTQHGASITIQSTGGSVTAKTTYTVP